MQRKTQTSTADGLIAIPDVQGSNILATCSLLFAMPNIMAEIANHSSCYAVYIVWNTVFADFHMVMPAVKADEMRGTEPSVVGPFSSAAVTKGPWVHICNILLIST
mmetsp:Transcript_72790/g.144253  ORF Transcript_72790/g.144253 Transcript_72790/m.144253 type:complete len:106 (+) Transcript_72790:118-435(+)